MKVRLTIDDVPFEVVLEANGKGWKATVDGETFPVRSDGRRPAVVRSGGEAFTIDVRSPDAIDVDARPRRVRILDLAGVAGAAAGGVLGPVKAPMTGKIDSIEVKEGQEVAAGDVLFVLEAMKMRNQVKSPGAGVVKAIRAKAGDAVDTKSVILDLVPTP